MKSVIVITECRRFRFNFGETLQAVALNRVISKMGISCITVSYENQKSDLQYWFLKNIREYGVRGLKFEVFRLKNMSFFVKRSNQREYFENILKKADAVICGSDCIWYEKNCNPIFFLDFPQINIPKIAYAPSLRDNMIVDTNFQQSIRKWTDGIDYLSTRELEGSKIIESISGRKVETVLDPTLLLDRNEWNRMITGKRMKESYVVMYMLGKTSLLKPVISQIKNYYKGRKLLWITMENNNGYPEGEGLKNVGPGEFISLIRHADAVVTDSFHGTAFSIIYRKPVYVIKRVVNVRDKYDHDCRIKNIFNILNIQNYYESNETIDFEKSKIDYRIVEKKLAEERKKSIKYLQNALKQDI